MGLRLEVKRYALDHVAFAHGAVKEVEDVSRERVAGGEAAQRVDAVDCGGIHEQQNHRLASARAPR